jgi:hypothetical protein
MWLKCLIWYLQILYVDCIKRSCLDSRKCVFSEIRKLLYHNLLNSVRNPNFRSNFLATFSLWGICKLECSCKIFKFYLVLTWSDIFSLVNLTVWKVPVFRCNLLIRNRGYIELETSVSWSFIKNIKTAINYFFTKVSQIIFPYFSLDKFSGTLGYVKHWVFCIPKMSLRIKATGIQCNVRLIYCVDKFSPRMPCQMGLRWYVRWHARILIGQSPSSLPIGMVFEP